MSTSKTIHWLKRIFSVQTLGILISLFGAYYTYKAYMQNEPSQLSYKYYERTDSICDNHYITIDTDVEEITDFYSFLITNIPCIQLGYGGNVPLGDVLSFPVISNKSDKSLKSFKCYIDIWYDKSLSEVFDENSDYSWQPFGKSEDLKITKKSEQSISFEYTNEYFPAGFDVPLPFNAIVLPTDKYKSIATEGALMKITYTISYDGISKPKYFQFHTRIHVIENDYTYQLALELFNKFLRNDVYTNWVGNHPDDDGKWALIVNNRIYTDIYHLSEDEAKQHTIENPADLQKDENGWGWPHWVLLFSTIIFVLLICIYIIDLYDFIKYKLSHKKTPIKKCMVLYGGLNTNYFWFSIFFITFIILIYLSFLFLQRLLS